MSIPVNTSGGFDFPETIFVGSIILKPVEPPTKTKPSNVVAKALPLNTFH